jgi:uncharacterized membrane protein
LVTLVAGFALKADCGEGPERSYPPPCYSDLIGIHESRSLGTGILPFLDFPDGGTFDDPGFLEYPVGTGAAILLAAAVTDTRDAFFLANVVILSLAAIAVAVLLVRMAGWRALGWAAAPILALYAFHNWDVLAVACAVAGCYLHQRGRSGWAGAWFGLGAAVKLYPILFLGPLVLERLWASDRQGAIRAALAGSAGLLLPNLALVMVNADAWWATYAFHSVREADLGSIWSLLLPTDASARMVNVVSGAVLVLTALGILAVGWWRARREGTFPMLAVASGLIVAFLLWSKVASPQYALWLLPSLVLLNASFGWWAAWNVLALFVYGISFGVGIAGYEPAMAPALIGTAAAIRAVVLVAIGAALLMSRPVGREPSLSQA